MIDTFLLDLNSRIRSWRDLREELKKCDDLYGLQLVANFWANAPLVKYTIDADKPKSWPKPWELLSENQYCQTAITYMMAETLVLSDKEKWKPRLKLIFIRDYDQSDESLSLLVDDQFLLNYSVGEVFDYDKIRDKTNISILFEWNIDDLP